MPYQCAHFSGWLQSQAYFLSLDIDDSLSQHFTKSLRSLELSQVSINMQQWKFWYFVCTADLQQRTPVLQVFILRVSIHERT